METLQITKDSALKAHTEANDKGKKLLENLFGTKVFQRKVTDRIKRFEDVLNEANISDNVRTLLSYNGTDPIMLAAVNFTKAVLICEVLNEGWKPNWDDYSEYKYYPWFDMRSSGGGFSYYVYACDYAYATVGARLVFKSSELAKYAGTQFIDVYRGFMKF